MVTFLRCPLSRGHEGWHRALVGVPKPWPQEVTLWWAGWESRWGWAGGEVGRSPAELYYSCKNCLLPRGHAGTCLDTDTVWMDEANILTLDRQLDRVVRLRISLPSPGIAVPRWFRAG